MPLDTCITNVGEYYSSHYLDSTFAKDIKDLLARWREQGSQAAPRRLQRLSEHFFRAKGRALEETKLEDRWQLDGELGGWHGHLLEALGYRDRQRADVPVEGGKTFVPIVGRVHRYNRPWLLICETAFCLPDGSLREGMPGEDPLGTAPRADQLVDPEHKLCTGDWSRVAGRVLTEQDAPRWLLLLAGTQLLLLDRYTYAQGRYLAFDLDDTFGRKERATFDHVAAFLARDTLCPDGESDEVLHDKLQEQSHKFAHGVTESLQLAVREAIELLANEWVEDRRRRGKSYTRLAPDETGADGVREITAERLKDEALVFVYRLLFCFYAEARGGELGLLPIDEDCYRLGYSLESIRDLEQVPLTAEKAAGSYFHEHLKRLFQIIHDGFNPRPRNAEQISLAYDQVRTFFVRPLTATLFAADATPLLNRARLANACLQQVVRKLSLSVDAKSRTIGRVNYAELGVNQLGAVYEGLLSYRGMFAERDLIHVKPARDDFHSGKTPTWFAPIERLGEFNKDEVERLEDGKPRIYRRGTFILHLSGIDRQQSASYYTPEVLTRSLVQESLRELLADYGPADADRILELKICEPAMGSGAFLNEAAEQLAARYLELKQQQLGRQIEPAYYGDELRRAKHYITTRNCYGVDLNATAVELGALSLWLGCIHRLLVAKGRDGGRDIYQSCATPWFGLRLRCGNSLIGARRAVWTVDQLRQGRQAGKQGAVPRLLKPGEPRRDTEIYHFLVFDDQMAPAHRDKRMRTFWPEACGRAKSWVAKEAKPKWTKEQTDEALAISVLVDRHWSRYAEPRAEALARTACTATVWPTAANSPEAVTLGPRLAEQERIKAELERSSCSFQRLRLVLDAWCALWFWPLDRVAELPGRDGFLASARLLLGVEAPSPEWRSILSAKLGFQIDALLAAAEDHVPDAQMLSDAVPWYDAAAALAAEQHFHHWELVFTEVLGPTAAGDGFDLIVGNPPWIRVQWEEPAVLCELEPKLGVREARSAEFNQRRMELLSLSPAEQDGGVAPVGWALLPVNNEASATNATNDTGKSARATSCAAADTRQLRARSPRRFYAHHFRKSEGGATFLNGLRLYPELTGMKANLYKNFIVRSWSLLGPRGILGLLHPEGPYDDAKGGLFRHMSNLYHPQTIAASLAHDKPHDPVPGIKTDEGNWNIRPHCHRVVTITVEELALFGRLLEEADTPPLQSRLPQVHAREILGVIRCITEAPRRLMDLEGEYYSTQMKEAGLRSDIGT